MDLGTGKDLEEYGDVPVHLIDICPAGYKYNLFEYLRDYREAYADIIARGKTPILCGGTGLYVESVLKGLSLPEVPENPSLRASLRGKSLEELTELLASMKTLQQRHRRRHMPAGHTCHRDSDILSSASRSGRLGRAPSHSRRSRDRR